MATYAIGDVQGCFESLQRLMTAIAFNPARDRLWFVGDLVNRGPRSLEVLRFLADQGKTVKAVLGNHDLHLLGRAAGVRAPRKQDTLDELLAARDCAALCEWLARFPLLVRRGDLVMVHAGLLPGWSLAEAERAARLAERALCGPRWWKVLRDYGDDDADRWPAEPGDEVQAALNVLTRLRACHADGRMNLAHKGPPGRLRRPWRAWFDWPAAKRRRATVIAGHWGALGLVRRRNLLAIDAGCVWGRELVAVRLEDRRIFAVDAQETR